jgi:hypothetical protein
VSDGVTIHPLSGRAEGADDAEVFTAARRAIQTVLEEIAAELGTIRGFAFSWLAHTLANSYGVSWNETGGSVRRLAERLSSNQPRTVVGAGPSLTRRALSGRPEGPLVAVDTALPALTAMGVPPDIVVSIDPQGWSTLHFRRRLSEQTILVADIGVTPRVITTSPRTVLASSNHPLHRLMERSGFPSFHRRTASRRCPSWRCPLPDRRVHRSDSSAWTAPFPTGKRMPGERTTTPSPTNGETASRRSKRFSPDRCTPGLQLPPRTARVAPSLHRRRCRRRGNASAVSQGAPSPPHFNCHRKPHRRKPASSGVVTPLNSGPPRIACPSRAGSHHPKSSAQSDPMVSPTFRFWRRCATASVPAYRPRVRKRVPRISRRGDAARWRLHCAPRRSSSIPRDPVIETRYFHFEKDRPIMMVR